MRWNRANPGLRCPMMATGDALAMAILTTGELDALLRQALKAQGFSTPAAAALARQTVLAEELGQRNLGVAHVFDYTDGLAAGRLDGRAIPAISRPAPTLLQAPCAKLSRVTTWSSRYRSYSAATTCRWTGSTSMV